MINKALFEEKIKSLFKTKAAFANALGIQPASLSEWLDRGVIPSARLEQVLEQLRITEEEEVDSLLGIEKPSFCYRAKKDLLEKDVAPSFKKRATKIAQIFFTVDASDKPANSIADVVRELQYQGTKDVTVTANAIRSLLGLTDELPLTIEAVHFALSRYGIKTFFIPFASFGMVADVGIPPLALTAKFKDKFLILCDSNRTFDEAHFDLTHELVHVFRGDFGVRNEELENFVDCVAEELIFPKKFLVKEFPFLTMPHHRIAPEDFLKGNFRKLMMSSLFMSPRGVAKALENYGFIANRSNTYRWLYEEEHEAYLKFFGSTLSQHGKMDFDFSDTEMFENFINNIVLQNPAKYPLFYQLCSDLTFGHLGTRAFAEIFNLDAGDVDELRIDWRFDGKFIEV